MPSHAEGGNPCDREETEWPAKVVLVGPEQVLGAMESGLPVQSERQNLLVEPLASSFHPDLLFPLHGWPGALGPEVWCMHPAVQAHFGDPKMGLWTG